MAIVVCLYFGLSVQANATIYSCHDKATIFLTMPNRHTLKELSDTNKSMCWNVIGTSEDDFHRLIHSVALGNIWSARYLAQIFHRGYLDNAGAHTEDALVALGQFSEHKMDKLLNLEKEGLLSRHVLIDALTMLPDTLSDDLNAQLQRLSIRKTLLLHTGGKDLTQEEAAGIKAINNAESEVRSHLSPMPIPAFIQTYAYLAGIGAFRGPSFNNCKGWKEDFCIFRKSLERYSEDPDYLSEEFSNLSHIKRISGQDRGCFSTHQECFNGCDATGTLFLSAPVPALGNGVVALLSLTDPIRTVVLAVYPDLTIKVLYASYNKKTWSKMQPKKQLGNILKARISGKTLILIQDKTQEHITNHTKFFLSLDNGSGN